MSTITTRSGKGSPLTNSEVDANFTNLNSDKYQSGDSISVADVTSSGDHTASIAASVTAAGTVQGDATALSNTYNVVSSATADQGVKLPTAASGLLYTVTNGTSVNVKLYPNTSGTINAGSANASIDLPAGVTSCLVGTSSTNWNTMVETVIYDSSGTRLN
jgi:hypothetical protein